MLEFLVAGLLLAAAPISPLLVDDHVIGISTFQSNNQKVVQNGQGIFIAYLRTRNEAFTAQQWRLARSTDAGESFQTIYESTDATNPPVLETDPRDNVYLAHPDFSGTNAYLYVFSKDKDYKNPEKFTIPNGSAGKYCMLLDQARQQLYYASHNGYLAIMGLDGALKASLRTHVPGPIAVQQYPHLVLDPAGVLYFAWTTNNNDKYLYRAIHCMRSVDGGTTWTKLDGSPLTLPVVADDTGPADRITLEDEYGVHTWLSSVTVVEHKAHFVYLAQFPESPRQHYMRFDARNGKRECDISPEFKGDALEVRSLDGFFTTGTGSTLFYTSQFMGKIVTLRSDDNGGTWHGAAHAELQLNPYAITGARTLTKDGCVIGIFTDSHAEGPSRLYFFRCAVASSTP